MIRYDFLLMVFMVLLFLTVARSDVIKYDSLKNTEEKTLKGIVLETKKQKMLLSKIKQLDSNAYIETISRQKLGLVKNGETAYKVLYVD